MAIKDIQPKQGNITIEAEVVDVGPAREFNKFGKPGKVATVRIKDNSGECKLSLWNEQVEQVKSGDMIRITNGYANEWQGELQLSTGRFGTLEILEKPAQDEKSSADTKTIYTNLPPEQESEPADDDITEEFIDED
jgi:replication factor A1